MDYGRRARGTHPYPRRFLKPKRPLVHLERSKDLHTSGSNAMGALCLGNPLRWVGRGNSNDNRLHHHQGKGYRFQHRDRFHEFAEKGWAFGDEAAASAKSDDKGAAAESEVSFVQGIGIYPLTDAGVMARTMVSGTKYWQDEDLH